jgi:hypothetical protein
MRASPRRSSARLSPLAVLVIAACAPPFDLNGRPPPCLDHYTLCDATGICLADGASSATPDGGSSSAGTCPIGYTLRQGGTYLIPAPFARLEDIASVSSSSDVTAKPTVAADGSIGVLVTAHHGATLGALDDALKERQVTITSAAGGAAATRHVMIYVSPIAAVAPDQGGNATNQGTIDSPFATFAQAASVAESGDTIYLRNGGSSVPGVGNTADGAVVKLQDDVTVEGHDGLTVEEESGQTELTMEVDLVGGATLSNITLDGHRLVVTTPGSQLVLQNSYIDEGITLDAKASVESADATPTNLHVYGGGLKNDGVTLSPLWVAADGATVTIENMARIGRSGGTDPTTAAVLFEGHGQTLTILDAAVVQNINGPAIRLSGQVHLEVNDASLQGGVEILDPASTAQLIGANLSLAENVGEIHFGGATLDIENGIFAGLAVVQDNPSSHVTMRHSSVSNYTQVGYHLLAGTLDLGTDSDQGNNFFKSTAPASGVLAQPTALLVESPLDGVAVTSSVTSYDSVTPGMCELTAEHGWPGIVTITQAAKVDFF